MENLQGVLDSMHETGEELVGLIGEPEKPEVEKNVEDADGAWKKLNTSWADRQKQLDEALRKATVFQDELMVSVDLMFKSPAIDELSSHGFVLFAANPGLAAEHGEGFV